MEYSLNLSDRNLDSENIRFILEMSYTGCSDPFPAISAQFTLKMSVTADNRQKYH